METVNDNSDSKGLDENLVTPCDVLLISGKCVTNESLLTGESTPQMKEPIPLADLKNREKLEIKGQDKRFVIFGGTSILQNSNNSSSSNSNLNNQLQKKKNLKTDQNGIQIPTPPDNGSIGMVLRTGFETSQGKLIRTILFATERVSANNLEALLFILFFKVLG
jgi:cation-transporting ATPase 13A1